MSMYTKVAILKLINQFGLMTTKGLAEKHSANCFLNSLLREWGNYFYDRELSEFVFNLNNEESLLVPIKYYSLVGRHDFDNKFLIRSAITKQTREISFLEMVDTLLHHLAESYKASIPEIDIFFKRIENSFSNITSAMNWRLDEINNLYSKSFVDFQEAEQALLIGHSFHPHPKSREEFSDEDYRMFSPEAGGEFVLQWLFVKPEVLHQQISVNFLEKKWTEKLLANDGGDNKYSSFLTNGYIPFPMHPWQWSIIKKNKDIQNYLSKKMIIECEENIYAKKWSATSSLRSLYEKSSPYMLKFSLSVRLTNSIRHLLPHEVVRGIEVMDVCSTKEGESFIQSFPDFHIVYEPAFMALIDSKKKIINETIVTMRLNPFDQKKAAQKIVLATLTQDHPSLGSSLIGLMLQRECSETEMYISDIGIVWFEVFLEKVIRPIILAQANWGILLGAHQQNLIVGISNNMPATAYFRDCQGTGYSELGFELFSKNVELLARKNGNILEEKMGNILFSYYLIINSTFNVIATIAKDTGVLESELISCLREKLITWKAMGVKDPSCFDYLLNEKTLMQKGNFKCSFGNLNENTAEDPLALYNPIPNPIYASNLC